MMTPAQDLRMVASLVQPGAIVSYVQGQYIVGKLASIADRDERDAHELREAAVQLAAHIDTLEGCSAEDRCELRKLPNFLLRLADRRAPMGAVFDPDDDTSGNVIEMAVWPRPLPVRLAVPPIQAIEERL